MTKYYIDYEGIYLGGYDGADPPDNAIEIDAPPPHGLAKLINGQWILPNEVVNTPILEELSRIDAKSIRALREGDQQRIAALEQQAADLRLKLQK